MRAIRIALIIVLGANQIALAEDVRDPSVQVRSCSPVEQSQRPGCLDVISGSLAHSSLLQPAASNWTVSETTSPVDYAPIVVAVVNSGNSLEGSEMLLTASCRNGRTEIVVSEPNSLTRSENYAVSYRINGGATVQIESIRPSFGSGVAFKSDAVRLLQTLPEDGAMDVQLVPRIGAARAGHFLLGGLKVVRDKLAAACKWAPAVAKPKI